jgi:glycosyltransferase, group 2 family
MAFDRRLLGKALPMPDAPVPHDIWLGLLAEYYGKVYFHHDTLIDYRRHDTNTSSATNVSQFSLVDKVAYRAAIVSSLLGRVFFDKNKFFEEQKS